LLIWASSFVPWTVWSFPLPVSIAHPAKPYM